MAHLFEKIVNRPFAKKNILAKKYKEGIFTLSKNLF
jgi:hypothetical protein